MTAIQQRSTEPCEDGKVPTTLGAVTPAAISGGFEVHPRLSLPARWTPALLDPRQLAYLNSEKRINFVYAGRRSFKTEAAKRRVVRAAVSHFQYPDARFFMCAPVQQQAEDIFWNDAKALVPPWALRGGRADDAIEESTCTIHLYNGAIIRVAGLDKPQRIEGGFWDGGVVSERADVAPEVIGEHILPMTIRGGWLDVEGVPGGRNHFYREVVAAEREILLKGADNVDVAVHHWKTGEVLHLYLGRERAEKELATARALLDPLTYDQEYNASWVTMEGMAYYQFREELHVAPALPYNRSAELLIGFDFNQAPGVAVICQDDEVNDVTNVLGEVYIEKNSNTPAVCRKIIQDWGKHRGEVTLYGDASGGARGSAKVLGSDWDLVRAEFDSSPFARRYGLSVPRANGAERARINAVNTRLLSTDGTVRLRINGNRCPMLVRDLAGVTLLKGGSGEIDKKADKLLTHISDALGYVIVRRHPALLPGETQEYLP